MACKISAVSDISTMPSVYISSETFMSPTDTPISRSLTSRTRSFANTANSVGDRLHTCLTPLEQSNYSVILLFTALLPVFNTCLYVVSPCSSLCNLSMVYVVGTCLDSIRFLYPRYSIHFLCRSIRFMVSRCCTPRASPSMFNVCGRRPYKLSRGSMSGTVSMLNVCDRCPCKMSRGYIPVAVCVNV